MARGQLEDCGLAPEFLVDALETLDRALADRCQEAECADSGPASRLGLLDWGRTYLREHFTKPPSAMHEWLAERLDALGHKRGEKINLVGPRGGAKSTIGTLAYVLRCALDAVEPYIWIVSDTRQQAQEHLRNLKDELIDNPELAANYPRSVGQGSVWRESMIVLRNGTMIEALGTGQRVRGRRRRAHRPTLIVCDDLQNDGHMRSATLREHTRRWFEGTLMKSGTKVTNVVNLATALHRDALAMRLSDTPGWKSRSFRAIVEWPTNSDLWRQWEDIFCDVENPNSQTLARDFYSKHRQAMDQGTEVLWPEAEDLYALMCMRVESGCTAFEREKQSSPIDPDTCEWPEEYFGPHIWFEHWPDSLTIKTIALDPSKGEDARHGDYSAIVALGIDENGVVYLEADMARRPVADMVSSAVAMADRFRPHVFGVETNQFQHLLADSLASEFREQDVVGVPIASINNTVNKRVRIRRLGSYLSMRKIRLLSHSPSTQLLVEQLRDFPAGAHDDGPDAAEMALRLAEEFGL